MNLPDAPIAHEGFFATHFFTVSDLNKSKDFYVRILGGKVIKPENPLLHQAGEHVAHSQFRRWPDSRQARTVSSLCISTTCSRSMESLRLEAAFH